MVQSTLNNHHHVENIGDSGIVIYIYVTTNGSNMPVSQLVGQSSDWLANHLDMYGKNYVQSVDWPSSWLTGIFEPSVVTYIMQNTPLP